MFGKRCFKSADERYSCSIPCLDRVAWVVFNPGFSFIPSNKSSVCLCSWPSLVHFTELSANRLSLLELTLQTTFPEWLCQAPWSSFCLSAIDVPLAHQPSAEMVLCCFSSGKCSSRSTVSRQRETINPRTEWTFRDAKRAFKNMSLGKAGKHQSHQCLEK